MSYYKCKCGTAHGNVHTPWNENKCPTCMLYPEFSVSGVKIQVALTFGNWYVYEVKNDGSYMVVMSCMTKLPTYEEIESQVNYGKSKELLVKKQVSVKIPCKHFKNNRFDIIRHAVFSLENDFGSKFDGTFFFQLGDIFKTLGLTDVKDFSTMQVYGEYLVLTISQDCKLHAEFEYKDGRRLNVIRDDTLSKEATQLFIPMTGGNGPIFPCGYMPSIQMVPESECETKSHCTCDTFLLMQSGCKCGFFKLEKEASKCR